MARPEKEAAVQEIAEHFRGSEAALLTEYRGLRVGELAELRVALRGAEADYKVLKNTLARLAVREVGLEELVGMLEGPTAIAFCKGDAAAAAKALDEAIKKFPVLVLKGGVLKGKIIDADQAKLLGRLEPREVQLAKIAMLMNTPAQQTVNVLSALLRNLGSMLAQVITQKETEAPAAEEPVAQTTESDEDAVPEGKPNSTPGGAEAPPQEQPSTETEESGAEPGGTEAAEDAKEQAKEEVAEEGSKEE